VGIGTREFEADVLASRSLGQPAHLHRDKAEKQVSGFGNE